MKKIKKTEVIKGKKKSIEEINPESKANADQILGGGVVITVDVGRPK